MSGLLSCNWVVADPSHHCKGLITNKWLHPRLVIIRLPHGIHILFPYLYSKKSENHFTLNMSRNYSKNLVTSKNYKKIVTW